MSFDEMINNHKNQLPTPPTSLHHSNSTQNAPRTNFLSSSVPTHMNHHNMVFNPHINQFNQHNPHFSHSPQPQVHHYNNGYQQNQGGFFLKPMGQHWHENDDICVTKDIKYDIKDNFYHCWAILAMCMYKVLINFFWLQILTSSS